MKNFLFITLFCCIAVIPNTWAHDKLGTEETFYSWHHLQLFQGLGLSGITAENGIEADGLGWAWRMGFAYAFTRRLSLEFFYQLNTLPITSPNPLGGTPLNSSIFMNSEVLRLLYHYDRYSVVPYVSAGLGLFHMNAVSPRTGLNFPLGTQLPLAAGLQTFLLKDRVSLKAEYTYHLLYDEEQNPGVLSLLGVSRIDFDVQSLIVQVTWHCF